MLRVKGWYTMEIKLRIFKKNKNLSVSKLKARR